VPAERVAGYDHPHLSYAPLPSRPRLSFAGGQSLAVVPVILLEVHEDPLPDWPQMRSVAGGLERDFPNISRVSTREYGHRVGIFRILDALDRHGIAPTVAIDALSAERYPFLLDWLTERGVEWIAHGISVTRPLGSFLEEEEEVGYVAETLDRLQEAGVRSRGWLGPEYGESERTPVVLAEAGLDYVCDWCCDEQPVAMTVPQGSITAFPLSADLDDQTSLLNRMLDPAAYEDHLLAAVDQLAKDGAESARVLAFCIRPWLLGQPFRIGIFERFLAHASTTRDVCFLQPSEVLWSIAPAQDRTVSG
jgi:hypothetical protein